MSFLQKKFKSHKNLCTKVFYGELSHKHVGFSFRAFSGTVDDIWCAWFKIFMWMRWDYNFEELSQFFFHSNIFLNCTHQQPFKKNNWWKSLLQYGATALLIFLIFWFFFGFLSKILKMTFLCVACSNFFKKYFYLKVQQKNYNLWNFCAKQITQK